MTSACAERMRNEEAAHSLADFDMAVHSVYLSMPWTQACWVICWSGDCSFGQSSLSANVRQKRRLSSQSATTDPPGRYSAASASGVFRVSDCCSLH